MLGVEVDDGTEKNPQIEKKAPVLQVVKIVFDSFLDAGIATPPVDLRPTSDANFQVMAGPISRDFGGELLNKVRTLRARSDYTHISLKNIKELGQFVQAGSAEKTSDSSSSRIIASGPECVTFNHTAGSHGSKLVHLEDVSLKTNAVLSEEDRARRCELNGRCNCQHEWGDTE
jgi:hypothetical protein